MLKDFRPLIIIMTISILIVSCQSEKNESSEIENSVKYIDVSNLDTTVRPQDDFYQYSNGNWMVKNEIPASKSSWGSFNILAEQNRANLKTIVDEAANDKTAQEGSITKKVGDFYKSGMDSLAIEELGISPIKDKIESINGIQTKEDLLKVAAQLRAKSIGTMFSMYVSQDDKNPDTYILQFYQGGLGLPERDYYFKTDERSVKIQEEYRSHISNMLSFLGYEEEQANKSANNIYELEKSLAENSRTRTALRDAENNYNKYTFEEFDNSLTNINLSNFISELEIQGANEVLVGQPEFFKGLNSALVELPLENWKDYLKWNTISDAASFLNYEIVKEDFNFYSTILNGVPKMEPRWKRVMLNINSSMGEAVGQVYVQKFFPPVAKEVALEMINDIQSAFKDRIEQLDWMAPETKEKAIGKLNSFTKKIGYPDKWKDYSTLEISENNYLQNLENASILEQKRNYNKIGQDIDKDEWFMTPPTVNAYYNPSLNEIVFPAGILAFPFFDFKADAAINYGAIGAAIGHEMTHGFDDQGSKYDASGALSEWWTESDREQFEAKTQVLVDQFSEFTVFDTVHVNGEMTLGENIADIGGLTIAYEGLQKYYERNGQPEAIDGFTGNQRFFLSFSQVWRVKFTDEALLQRINTDVHSPGMFRVNGVLKNMPEFYEAFEVKEGDPMYRPDNERAKIW